MGSKADKGMVSNSGSKEFSSFARMVSSYKVSVADGSVEVLRLVTRDLDFQYCSLMAAQTAR